MGSLLPLYDPIPPSMLYLDNLIPNLKSTSIYLPSINTYQNSVDYSI